MYPSSPPRKSLVQRSINILAVLLIGVAIGRYAIPADSNMDFPARFVSTDNGERELVFPTFWNAWDALHNNYIEDLDDTKLFYGAVSGMVRAAGDPYTVFSDPEETKQFQETLSGQFSGIGVEIGMRNGLVTIIAPLSGSPADEAGLLEEDVVIAVDGQQITQDMSLDDVVRKIRGPRGEEVVLTIVREGEHEPQEIAVVRDTITIESVKVSYTEDNIAHIQLTNFNGDTTKQFAAVAREIRDREVAGIVLDVRNNPGGYLQTAVEVASYFIDSGQLVVSEEGKQEKEYKAKGNPILQDIPTTVLINGGSASASEILAGSLHDQLGIPVIGTQSFGKGSVQELIPLKDGSSLRVTIAKWFTPSGRSIDDEGITPSIEVQNDRETEEDEQLERAFEELKNS